MSANAISQYLTFTIAGEQYAVGVAHVKEIIGYDVPTKVPGTPPWIRGVINLRGLVVPVVDLAVKFGRPATDVTRRTCVVIVDVQFADGAVTMGVVADGVSQVLDLSADDIQPPPTFGMSVRLDFLLGLITAGKQFALLLDIDRVLAADELLAAISLEAIPEVQQHVQV
ncbi:MAG: purine-binding chemotaxis protein CheW [Acidobacteriota bacterium]|jgi:purine-binding chemotaxis protein CheW|nr:purine-binding chemotaxis protein CheW [Acidobacteriota bacterium]